MKLNLPFTIHQRVVEAENVEALRLLRDQAAALLETACPPDDMPDYNRCVNKLHDAFIRRSVQLAEREIENRGLGTPPVSYAFLLFGSGGRSEQTLWSDQDNGLVYADTRKTERERTDHYFAVFSEQLVTNLELLGYPPCDGDVICRNPVWRKPLGDYLDMVDSWLAQPNWVNVRYALIVADLKGLYGDVRLANLIKMRLYETISNNAGLLRHLLENTLHRKIALGVFGQLITERYGEEAGGVDIKYGAYIPLVNAVRLLAIQAGIMESSTLARLDGLAETGAVTEELTQDWREAFITCLRLRAFIPVTLKDGKYMTSGKLPADRLTPLLKKELKLSLHAGERLQKYVRHRVEKETRH